MKQLFIALAMLAALGLPAETAAQKHRHTPRPAAVAQSQTADTSAIEAFSDTAATASDTATAATAATVTPQIPSFQVDMGENTLHGLRENVFGIIGILLILFVFSPVAIIGVVCFFIYKLRKQKVKLAEMAIKNGQPIPHDLRNDSPRTPEQYWKTGVKKVAVGLGLVVLFVAGFDSWALASIGFFVAIYGAGQLVIAKTAAKKEATGDDSADAADLTPHDFENT